MHIKMSSWLLWTKSCYFILHLMLNIELKFQKVDILTFQSCCPCKRRAWNCVSCSHWSVWMCYLILYMQIIYQHFDLKRFQRQFHINMFNLLHSCLHCWCICGRDDTCMKGTLICFRLPTLPEQFGFRNLSDLPSQHLWDESEQKTMSQHQCLNS